MCEETSIPHAVSPFSGAGLTLGLVPLITNTAAISESVIANVCDAVGDCDAGQSAAISESVIANISNAVGDCIYACFAGRAEKKDSFVFT